MEQPQQFDKPIKTNRDVTNIVLDTLCCVYENNGEISNGALREQVIEDTGYTTWGVHLVLKALYNEQNPYLRDIPDTFRSEFVGTAGLWLLEDACSEPSVEDSTAIAQNILERSGFFKNQCFVELALK